MPVSQPNNIERICDIIKQKKPLSILDVGCGFGMLGMLSRIYAGLWTSDLPVEKYKNWRNITKVDAIEVYKPWIQDLQKLIYNDIYIGDVREKIKEVGEYDMIIFGDVLEHLTKEDGLKVLEEGKKKAKTVVISMPTHFNVGNEKGGNKWELHQYVWKKEDFAGGRIMDNKKYRVVLYE